jgi:hypothetical protein
LAQYYYLVASFPMLFLDSERPPAIDSFVAVCGEHLSPRDFRIVETASISTLEFRKPSCTVLDRWRSWETALRNELVKLRAKSRGIDPDRHVREGAEIVSVADIARSAFGQEIPLAAEQVLNRARWEFLDELEEGHYFDLEKVVVYYLRLQILHRKGLFDAATGAAAFEEIYKGIARPIYEGAAPKAQGE